MSKRDWWSKTSAENQWFLLSYALDLAEFREAYAPDVKDAPPNIYAVLAQMLCSVVEERMRRNLSWGYRERVADLSRVRGRIELLRTETHGLLEQGKVACRFDELTMDTPRNRLVRAALIQLAGAREWKKLSKPSHMKKCEEIENDCRRLEVALARLGVRAIRPSSEELASDPVGWFDREDRLMIGLANAVFGVLFPQAGLGKYAFSKLGHAKAFSKLYEVAIRNFYDLDSSNLEGWKLQRDKKLEWDAEVSSKYMPRMVTDMILEKDMIHGKRRIIIDTKAKEIMGQSYKSPKPNKSSEPKFLSGDLYQIYAYLRSQEKERKDGRVETAEDVCFNTAEGVLLYPLAEGEVMDECVCIQGHDIRFVTIDLEADTDALIARLRSIPLRSRLHLESEAKAA